ncbi:hypothetical protein KHM19_29040 [Leptospira borgpetersenii]|nr:hypothetical protein KHM09_32460 [Leptospira borgpetersenii]GIM23721.1 hypothetical protein KHM19_29040 [Leptospira borgpetersenii]GIM27021.1 hypothetical protein KHM25_29460 [Leptospira borgpetersenii]
MANTKGEETLFAFFKKKLDSPKSKDQELELLLDILYERIRSRFKEQIY